jgi:hypothetical protein
MKWTARLAIPCMGKVCVRVHGLMVLGLSGPATGLSKVGRREKEGAEPVPISARVRALKQSP